MKILHIITLADAGGAQSVVQHLANSHIVNNDVAVVAARDGIMWEMLHPRIKQYKIGSLIRELSLTQDLITIWRLVRINKEFAPDIIHLHSSKIGALGRICLPSKKIVYTVHGFDSIRLAFPKFLFVEKLLNRFCRAIVAVSNYDKKNLYSEGITHNVHMIYNGVNILPINGLSVELKNKSKIITCIARMDPQKDFLLFNEIAKALPSYNFIWIGNAKKPDFEAAENTYWLGEIKNASAYFSISDLCILTTNYEGLPMSIIEAMAYCKPIISSKVGGIPEIVIDNVNGFTLPNEVQEFVTKIEMILGDSELHSKMAGSSRRIYEEKLTVEHMSTEYLSLYKSILK